MTTLFWRTFLIAVLGALALGTLAMLARWLQSAFGWGRTPT